MASGLHAAQKWLKSSMKKLSKGMPNGCALLSDELQEIDTSNAIDSSANIMGWNGSLTPGTAIEVKNSTYSNGTGYNHMHLQNQLALQQQALSQLSNQPMYQYSGVNGALIPVPMAPAITTEIIKTLARYKPYLEDCVCEIDENRVISATHYKQVFFHKLHEDTLTSVEISLRNLQEQIKEFLCEDDELSMEFIEENRKK